MKAIKVIVVLAVIYVGIVVLFESLIGYFQPAGEGTVVITTIGADGLTNDRVLSSLQSNGQLYVAANHWPRSWYNQARENPEVQVTIDGEQAAYTAVPVTGAEHDRVDGEHSLGPVVRFLTGFPPRYFLRLDPS